MLSIGYVLCSVEINQTITLVSPSLNKGYHYCFGFGFTTVGDWLFSLIGEYLVLFWVYDTQLKTALYIYNPANYVLL